MVLEKRAGSADRLNVKSESNHISIYIPIFLPSHALFFLPTQRLPYHFPPYPLGPFSTEGALFSIWAQNGYLFEFYATHPYGLVNFSFLDGRIISLMSAHIFVLSAFVYSAPASAASVLNANERRCF